MGIGAGWSAPPRKRSQDRHDTSAVAPKRPELLFMTSPIGIERRESTRTVDESLIGLTRGRFQPSRRVLAVDLARFRRSAGIVG